ncbi:MAG: glycosyltransferase, partial [Chloroflexi bacterium]
DLAEALASADVFLFTGPNETFGQVVQEAMASGLPAIVIDAGGVADLVQEGITGYKCPPEPQAFAEKVQLLRDNPSLRLQLSEQVRAFALTRPWSHIMAQLESYYSEALRLNERYQRIFQKSPPMIPAKGV